MGRTGNCGPELHLRVPWPSEHMLVHLMVIPWNVPGLSWALGTLVLTRGPPHPCSPVPAHRPLLPLPTHTGGHGCPGRPGRLQIPWAGTWSTWVVNDFRVSPVLRSAGNPQVFLSGLVICPEFPMSTACCRPAGIFLFPSCREKMKGWGLWNIPSDPEGVCVCFWPREGL